MKPSKYRAKPTIVDGIRFASQKEARRYSDLKLLERAREIFNLEVQVSIPFKYNGRTIFKYVADFRYEIKDREFDSKEWKKTVIEDVKGMKTPLYKLKKKLIEAAYDITITET